MRYGLIFKILSITINIIILCTDVGLAQTVGELDTSFGDLSNGVIAFDYDTNDGTCSVTRGCSNEVSYDVDIDVGGNAYVIGVYDGDIILLKYDENGNLNSAGFGINGATLIDFYEEINGSGSAVDKVGAIVVLGSDEGYSSDKDIYIGGNYQDTNMTMAMALVDADGLLVTAAAATDFSSDTYTEAITSGDFTLPDSSSCSECIVLAGYVDDGSDVDIAIAWFENDGTYLGSDSIDIDSSTDDIAYGVAINSEGKIVLVGQTGTDLFTV